MFIFCYGWKIHAQLDRVAMESPLGPVLANIFMTELEISMIPLLGNYLINVSATNIMTQHALLLP